MLSVSHGLDAAPRDRRSRRGLDAAVVFTAAAVYQRSEVNGVLKQTLEINNIGSPVYLFTDGGVRDAAAVLMLRRSRDFRDLDVAAVES